LGENAGQQVKRGRGAGDAAKIIGDDDLIVADVDLVGAGDAETAFVASECRRLQICHWCAKCHRCGNKSSVAAGSNGLAGAGWEMIDGENRTKT
jgi:hypothetical protein